MAKLHELLAAEKTPTSAWNQLYEDTLKKFKNPTHFFAGHSRSLRMIVDSPENEAIEAQEREEKPVTTTVLDTLLFALDIFAKAEDLQYQKNSTNRLATGDVMWQGKTFLPGLPVDELLGLEARLTRLRLLFAEIPTLDASKEWRLNAEQGKDLWTLLHPEAKVKTKKIMTPVIMAQATDKHPAQVTAVTEDVPVGTTMIILRSGCATALQKAEMLKTVDELLVEVKQARMRANETTAVKDKIAGKIVDLLLQPLREIKE